MREESKFFLLLYLCFLSPNHRRALSTAPTAPRAADREPERGDKGDIGDSHVASPAPRSPSPAAASDPEDEYDDAAGLAHFDMGELFHKGPTEAELEAAALNSRCDLPSPSPARQSGRKRNPTAAAVLSLEQQEQRIRR